MMGEMNQQSRFTDKCVRKVQQMQGRNADINVKNTECKTFCDNITYMPCPQVSGVHHYCVVKLLQHRFWEDNTAVFN